MSELLLLKRQQTTNVGENTEKMEPLYTIGVLNRYSYYVNCRKVLKNIQNKNYHTIQQFHFWVFIWSNQKH